MTLTIILLAYVANVFLNRWINKIAHKIDDYIPKMVLFWFVPIIPSCMFLFLIAINKYDDMEKDNWFTGKHW